MHRPPEKQSVDDWLTDYAGGNVTPIQSPAAVAPEKNSSQKNDGEGVVEEHSLIPAGEYQAWFLDHKLHPNFKGDGDKLVISFSVTESDYEGEIVRSFYNITITKTICCCIYFPGFTC